MLKGVCVAHFGADGQPELHGDSHDWLLELGSKLAGAATDWKRLIEQALIYQVREGQFIVSQFHPTTHLYLLLQGSVRFSMRGEEAEHGLLVGHSHRRWTPIGWAGFRPPYRHAVSVTATSAATLLGWPFERLHQWCEREPELVSPLLDLVGVGAAELLGEVRERLAGSLRRTSRVLSGLNRDGEEDVVTNSAPPPIAVLRRSAFFSVFDDQHLLTLAKAGSVHYFCRGERLVQQADRANAIQVLASGRTQLRYRAESSTELTLGGLDSQGQLLSWCALMDSGLEDVSVVALRDGALLRVPREELEQLCARDASFAVQLRLRLLWLMGRHLRSARAQLISESFDRELLAVRSIIEQNCTQLSVASPLHKLPHLLSSPVTLDLAFQILDTVAKSSCLLEAHIARSCAEVLGPVRDEQRFFSALQEVYQTVTSAPADESSAAVRGACARKFRETFDKIPHAILGVENLPKTPGHIFIFNHLRNHEYNTLPNNFQLTLDSHFISSMVLDAHYGDPGVRVVRKSRAAEYGHHCYYERLGHISVYTRESDQPSTPRDERLREFLKAARECLESGLNLIVAPEGTSHCTQESPGEFRPGAFRLALSLAREPLIVPVAVANFDRRLNHTALGLVVKAPFLVSDFVANPEDTEALGRFLVELRQAYRGYVQEAVAVADACWDASTSSCQARAVFH